MVETEADSEEAGAWIEVALEGDVEEAPGDHLDLSWSRWEAEAEDVEDQEKWTSMAEDVGKGVWTWQKQPGVEEQAWKWGEQEGGGGGNGSLLLLASLLWTFS